MLRCGHSQPPACKRRTTHATSLTPRRSHECWIPSGRRADRSKGSYTAPDLSDPALRAQAARPGHGDAWRQGGGAVNLMRLTLQDSVRHFIGFGSIAGRLGSNGQTDYALASDALCKLAAWYQGKRPGVHSVGFHWHPWDEVGMAANPETVATMKLADGPARMPKDKGVKHLLRELYAGPSEGEVLITDWEYHGRYYGTEHHPKPLPDGESSPAVSAPPAAQPSDKTASLAGAPSALAPATAATGEAWDAPPQKRIAARRELRIVSAPLPADAPTSLEFVGPVCILGDNPAAHALRDRLAAAGVAVHMLPITMSPDEAMAAIEAMYQSAAPRYLFLMSGRDEDGAKLLDAAGWQRRRALGVVVPFQATQHWFRLRMKARDKTPITIVAVTSLGGDFGLSGQIGVPDGGALAGVVKSISIEDSRERRA